MHTVTYLGLFSLMYPHILYLRSCTYPAQICIQININSKLIRKHTCYSNLKYYTHSHTCTLPIYVCTPVKKIVTNSIACEVIYLQLHKMPEICQQLMPYFEVNSESLMERKCSQSVICRYTAMQFCKHVGISMNVHSKIITLFLIWHVKENFISWNIFLLDWWHFSLFISSSCHL